RRCVKTALRMVKAADNARFLPVAARRKLTDKALKGLRMITAAVRAGACSPIPGFDGERLEECVAKYKALHTIAFIKRRRSGQHGEYRKAAAAHWAYKLLDRYKIKPTVYQGGPWHVLARELYGGDGSADLFQAIRDYDPSAHGGATIHGLTLHPD